MRRKIIPRDIKPSELEEVRAFIRDSTWEHARSERYKKTPHRYIIKFRANIGVESWQRFSDLIRDCGRYRNWTRDGKTYRYRYLIVDGDCYWTDWPALNRADAKTLDPLPRGTV